ncbi:MAG: MBL fold metallo-hydrolase [Treponema sp.]|nr:MBL fold metallo-hydrolase [Treponema sp.]
MEIKCIQTGVFRVNTYIVPVEGNKVFVVDPAACAFSGDENKITLYLEKNHLECVAVLLTHCHFDHISGILPIKQKFPKAKIVASAIDAPEIGYGMINKACLRGMGLEDLAETLMKQPKTDTLLHEGDDFYGWKVMITPGHTSGSLCLYNEAEKKLISGDTLFYNGYGRTDLPTGSDREMAESLERLRREIPFNADLYPGH